MVALEGGAGLIDVKEPSRGSLGRADDQVIRNVVRAVNGRRPVSAALSEWAEGARDIPDCNLAFVKWGLAGCGSDPDWRLELGKLLKQQRPPQIVLAAYADWTEAKAPSVDNVLALAADFPGSVLLLDTHRKDGRTTLLDFLSVSDLEDLCNKCRRAGVRIALAGSLGKAEISQLDRARPDWFAVRGAACNDGNREAGVQFERVRELVDVVRSMSAH
jgi:uncharacterized protein (UPF0264 family)